MFKFVIPLGLIALLVLSGCVQTNSTNPPGTPPGSACNEKWSCGDWSVCANEKQTRECSDLAKCEYSKLKPVTEQACVSETPKELNLKLGETTKAANLDVTVTAVEKSDLELTSFYGQVEQRAASNGKQYFTAWVKVKNTGTSDIRLTLDNFGVVDAEGNIYDSELFVRGDGIRGALLSPGQGLEGTIMYEVPQNVSKLRVFFEYINLQKFTELERAFWIPGDSQYQTRTCIGFNKIQYQTHSYSSRNGNFFISLTNKSGRDFSQYNVLFDGNTVKPSYQPSAGGIWAINENKLVSVILNKSSVVSQIQVTVNYRNLQDTTDNTETANCSVNQ